MNQLYISPHTGQNFHHQKIYTQYMLEREWRKGNPLALLIGMQFDKTLGGFMENRMQVPYKRKIELSYDSSIAG